MAQKSSHAARKKGGVWKILLVLAVLLALAVGGALLLRAMRSAAMADPVRR